MKDDRKTRIILITVGVLLALLLIASSVWASHRANERRDRIEQTTTTQTDPRNRSDKTAKAGKQRSRKDAASNLPGVNIGDGPEDVCGELAPKALEQFIAGADLDDLFTSGADGLEWAGKNQEQTLPADQWTGFLNASQKDEAVCAVWTGEESPWILQYRHTNDKGWLVDWINGPGMGMKNLQPGKPDPIPERESEAATDE